MTSAWPFLVGRTRNAGHRVVLAPDFMIAEGTTSSLTRISRGGPDTLEGEVVLDLLPDGLMVVSRVFVAESADYGVDGTGPLRDGGGRPIRLTEGLVVRGDAQRVTSADLARGHETAAAAFRRFWVEENDHEAEGSTGFALAGDGESAPPPSKRKSRWLFGGLAVLLLAGAAAVGVVRVTGDDPPPAVVTVTRTAPEPTTTGCATPTPACLITPADLVDDAAIVIDAPNAVMKPDAGCASDRGAGLRLTWAKVAGSMRLDWSRTSEGHVDLTGRARAELSIRTEGGVDGLELVVADTKGHEGAKVVPLAAFTGRQTMTVDLTVLPNLDLASVRSIGLRWPQGHEEGSGICLTSVAFR
ncbi:hypothetical protein [Umezawaea sp. Da 62-37]|uniref:hypothetical protein n=1 Tax=Umezawaea sp. Da 62-37 TaxID=3075927 RepID=UPI0028F6DFB1|nr:hypothetical protein [Umezawaea sp. Da 62-37]WNV89937.1 hypothetical protein RM788_17045 [Umezawaea sp. Da 62-37]